MKIVGDKSIIKKKIVVLPIDAITAHKQARQLFKSETIRQLATSIKAGGIYYDIEVDENNVIITGERRWRAAKIAGLKKIRCVRITGLTPRGRFKRQMIENIQRENMNPMDTAEGWYKLLSTAAVNKGAGHWNDKGVADLAKEFDIPRQSLSDSLKLLELSKTMQGAVRNGKVPPSVALVTLSVPVSHRKVLEENIITEKVTTKDSAKKLAGFLNSNLKKGNDVLKTAAVAQPVSDADIELIEKIRELAARLDNLPVSVKSGQAAIVSGLAELKKKIKKFEGGYNKITSLVAINSQATMDLWT